MKRKKILNTLLGLFILFLPAAVSAQEITVAAAANVQYTLGELKEKFEKNTAIKIQTIIGSSGKLAAQIENGAPFDIFISADMVYPEKLYQEGLAHDPPKIYAYGVLVLWTLKSLDLSKGIEALRDLSVKKIAIANPQTAPYGRQAINAIRHDQLDKDVESKLVYGESIAQVNQFIAAQAVDVGFTAKSLVLAPSLKQKGQWVEIDPGSYDPIAQGVVILKQAEKSNLKAAQTFHDFLFSPQAREIFKKYGYVLP